MVVINYRDQFQPGTCQYAIHYLIDNKLDLSIFFPNYNNDDGGRPAYDPAILLKIILFAYSKLCFQTITSIVQPNMVLSCNRSDQWAALLAAIRPY